MRRFALILVVFFLLPLQVHTAVINVPTDQPTIQAGIDVANNGDTVLVAPGNYIESIDFNGTSVAVVSVGGPEVTSLTGTSTIDVLIANGETEPTAFVGFSFTGGNWAFSVHSGSYARIANNIFTNYSTAINAGNAGTRLIVEHNLFHHNQVGLGFIGAGDVRITNNTFDSNDRGMWIQYNSTTGYVRNNIVTNSNSYGIYLRETSVELLYNDLWNNNPNYDFDASPGIGDISLDPVYNSSAGHGYALDYNSPCIDVGDPDPFYNDPDSTRNDLGAFFRDQSRSTYLVPQVFSSIQAAIDASNNGDTILVANGVYEEVRLTTKGRRLLLTSQHIFSGDTSDIYNTVIQNPNIVNCGFTPDPLSAPIFEIVDGEDTNTVIHGFTVTGGSGDTASGKGGGFLIVSSSPKVEYCRIINNCATSGGAGLFAQNSALVLRNCTVSNNFVRQGNGSGINVSGVGYRIENNLISLNGPHRGSGGGAFLSGTNAVVSQNRVINNTADSFGNGVGGIDCEATNCTFIGNYFSGNISVWGAYALIDGSTNIHVQDTFVSQLIYSDAVFDSCLVRNSSRAFGWAINATIINSRFVDCDGPVAGGHTVLGCVFDSCSVGVDLDQGTVFGSEFRDCNVGVQLWSSTIDSCVFTNCNTGIYSQASGTVTRSIFDNCEIGAFIDVDIDQCAFIENDRAVNYCGNTITNSIFIRNKVCAIDFCGAPSTEFNSNIFLDNDTCLTELPGGPAGTYRFNCFWSNDVLSVNIDPQIGDTSATSNINGTPSDLFYNIVRDPLVDSVGIWSWPISGFSPCIDAGDPNPVFYDPDGTVNDIGPAYFDQLLDIDSDGIVDSLDNCPTISNVSQSDGDDDGRGDPCDNCLEIANFSQTDSDNDGTGDACDICPGSDDTIDTDGDSAPDGCDICAGFDDSIDSDLDGVPDGCDICAGNDDNLDIDSDGIPNGCDPCPGNPVSPCCCDVAGDADNNGSITIGDVTFIINVIFTGTPLPVCNDAADADGNNSVNIGDVTYLIARIFSGGSAPTCGTTGN